MLRLPSFNGRTNAAKVAGAVIVSVAMPGLEPSVTGDGETLQVAKGAGPVTAQLRVTAPEKPFCPVSIKVSVTCIPFCVETLEGCAMRVKSGGGLNVAVTD